MGILRKECIGLQRQRSRCISPDKNFTINTVDIEGLYLSPPLNAIVFCAGEKPNTQALKRKTGYIKTDSGKFARAYKSTYKRHSTLNLFATLDAATGKINGKETEKKVRIFKHLCIKLLLNTMLTIKSMLY